MIGNKFSKVRASVGNKHGSSINSMGLKGVNDDRQSSIIPTATSEISSNNGSHIEYVPTGINHSETHKPKPFQVERKRNNPGNTQQFS